MFAQYVIEEFAYDTLTFKTDLSCVGPNNAIYSIRVESLENSIKISKVAKDGELIWFQNHPDLTLGGGSDGINFDFEKNNLVYKLGSTAYIFDEEGNLIEEVDLTDVLDSGRGYIATRDGKTLFYDINKEAVEENFVVDIYGMQVDLNTLQIDTIFKETETISGFFNVQSLAEITGLIINGFKIELFYTFEKGDDPDDLTLSHRSRILSFDYSWNKDQDHQIEYDAIPGAGNDDTYLELSYYGQLICKRAENGDWTAAKIGDCEIDPTLDAFFNPMEFENGDILYYNSIYDCNAKIMDINQNLYELQNIPNSDTLYSIFRDTLRFIYTEIESTTAESEINSVVQIYPTQFLKQFKFLPPTLLTKST